MKRKMTSVLAILAGIGLASPALADCQAELNKFEQEMNMEAGGQISKDGSLAPLESADSTATEMSDSNSTEMSDSNSTEMSDSNSTEISDSNSTEMSDTSSTEMSDTGSTEMSDSDTADTDSDSDTAIVKDGSTAPLEADTSSIATSGQDAARQQEDASDDSSDDKVADGMTKETWDAIEAAQVALAEGDEGACMAALEKARGM